MLTKPKQLKEARTLLHNLVVVSLHLPRPRVYQIKEFVDSDSYNNVVNLNGQDVTLVDYFKLKYNITLTRPDMYVFRTKDRKTGELSVHPLELYQVCDNQRVLHDNTLPDQIAELIKVGRWALQSCRRCAPSHRARWSSRSTPMRVRWDCSTPHSAAPLAWRSSRSR